MYHNRTGNIYIDELYSSVIRKASAVTGFISTIAGLLNTNSYSGDGDQATSAALYYPYGVTVDSNGMYTYLLFR